MEENFYDGLIESGTNHSPHFYDDNDTGPSVTTRKEEDLKARKYSVYRKAREALVSSPLIVNSENHLIDSAG